MSNGGATNEPCNDGSSLIDAAAEARCERGGPSQERAASARDSRRPRNWL